MRKYIWRNTLFCLGLSAMAPVMGQTAPSGIQLRSEQSYTVKSGDTLWGIAAHFLRHPWQWPQIWHKNPYIHNPNLIYPGDRIVLTHGANGQPELRVERSYGSHAAGSSVVELHPQMTVEPLSTVATGEVMPFLGTPGFIASKKAYDALPYLAASASSGQLAYTVGDKLYASGLKRVPVGTRYGIVALGPELRRPGVEKPLGYALYDLGSIIVRSDSSHAAVEIADARREISLGDRLIPEAGAKVPRYFPSAPAHPVSARIIAKMSDYPELLVGQAVIVDQGREAGLSDGNLLRIERTRGDTKNAVTGKSFALPPQKVGEVMVFRVFPTVSYAVITMATHGILVGDKLVSPRPVTASDSSAGNG